MSARAAWREVCMAEYRITGDMWKAIKFADSVAQRFRAETLREAADKADSMAGEMRSGEFAEYPEEWSSRDVRDAVQAVGGELRYMAEESE